MKTELAIIVASAEDPQPIGSTDTLGRALYLALGHNVGTGHEFAVDHAEGSVDVLEGSPFHVKVRAPNGTVSGILHAEVEYVDGEAVIQLVVTPAWVQV